MQQVLHDLAEPHLVDFGNELLIGQRDAEILLALLEPLPRGVERMPQDRSHIGGPAIEHQGRARNTAHVEEILHQAAELGGLAGENLAHPQL